MSPTVSLNTDHKTAPSGSRFTFKNWGYLDMLAALTALLGAVGFLVLNSARAVNSGDWQALNASIGGRLGVGIPYAQSCFSVLGGNISHVTDNAECALVQAGNGNHTFRADTFGGYSESQWETCQTTTAQCLLDNVDPTDPAAFSPPRECSQGSVPLYYIDVTGPQDAVTAFQFVKKTGATLVIKNTGHDYFGRSSAPGSLALWTHHLRNISYSATFLPEGCPAQDATSAITMGAGQQFQDIINFATAQNVTFMGGADTTVGASGGWVQGGGHSALSPVMGLGVDRVLEFKIVTPDGVYRTVNRCQNVDLFFALRGGGGGTWGVVIESTFIASPQVELQVVFGQYNDTVENTQKLTKALAQNAVEWSSAGWGGYFVPPGELALYINPKLDTAAANASIQPFYEAFASVGGHVTFQTFPSFGDWFNTYIPTYQDPVGAPFAMASRLIPATSFNDTELIDLIAEGMTNCSFPQILQVAPYGFKDYDVNGTAVSPAWRESVWHVILSNEWNYNATLADRTTIYSDLETLFAPIRARTSGSGAYFNEADVYEPNYETTFWGDNYPKLLSIKQKYDPDSLLDCWHCVGWNGQEDSRYSCYIDI